MDDSAALIASIRSAFAGAAYPGDDEIVHCEYDRRWGGTLPGPCRECSEVVEHFRGTTNTAHTAAALRGVAFALHSFSFPALVYWLPAFLIACVEEPEEADVALDSVEYRFREPRTPQEEAWHAKRVPRLSDEQLAALISYFEYQMRNDRADLVEAASAVSVLRAELRRRHG